MVVRVCHPLRGEGGRKRVEKLFQPPELLVPGDPDLNFGEGHAYRAPNSLLHNEPTPKFTGTPQGSHPLFAAAMAIAL